MKKTWNNCTGDWDEDDDDCDVVQNINLNVNEEKLVPPVAGKKKYEQLSMFDDDLNCPSAAEPKKQDKTERKSEFWDTIKREMGKSL